MMTKEQKIEWLRNASTEQLVKQFETSVAWHTSYSADHFDAKVFELAEDVELVKTEIIRRLENKDD